MPYPRLTDEEQIELESHRGSLDIAKKATIAWLDAKALEKASVKPGELLFNLDTYRLVGEVKRVYRYPEDDRTFNVNYEYEPPCSRNCIDNTSRQSCVEFGSKAECVQRMRDESKRLAQRANDMVRYEYRNDENPIERAFNEAFEGRTK